MRLRKDIRFTIISKLDDPDAYGAERVVISNASFDDVTLADWEVAKKGSVEAPFTFTDYDFLDKVEG
nr:phage tail tube protein [Lachnoclostridium phytofermentans]